MRYKNCCWPGTFEHIKGALTFEYFEISFIKVLEILRFKNWLFFISIWSSEVIFFIWGSFEYIKGTTLRVQNFEFSVTSCEVQKILLGGTFVYMILNSVFEFCLTSNGTRNSNGAIFMYRKGELYPESLKVLAQNYSARVIDTKFYLHNFSKSNFVVVYFVFGLCIIRFKKLSSFIFSQ